MERLSERLTAIEAVLKKLEPVEGLLERVAAGKYHLHDQEGLHFSRGVHVYRRVRKYVVNSHRTKSRTTSLAARCSTLRRKKEAGRVARPQKPEPTVDDAMRMATEVSATQPFFNQKQENEKRRPITRGRADGSACRISSRHRK